MLFWCWYMGKCYCGCTIAYYPNVALCLMQVQVLLRLYTSLSTQHCPVFDAGASAAAAVH